jgi:multiple sugar transport system ATP-binding protein
VAAGAVAFAASALRLDLHGYAFAAPPADGRPVVLGVRPEHIALDAAAAIEARVRLVEPMGPNQILWLDVDGTTLAVNAASAPPIAADAQVRVAIDLARASLFDAHTELRL